MPTISFDRKRRINAFKTKVIRRNNTYRKRGKLHKDKWCWECLLCWNENTAAALPNVETYNSSATDTLSKMLNLSAFLPKCHSLGSLATPGQWSKNTLVNPNLLMRRGRQWQIQGISLGSKSGTPGVRKRILVLHVAPPSSLFRNSSQPASGRLQGTAHSLGILGANFCLFSA